MTTITQPSQVSHCFHCHQRIEMLGGSWTDPSGCIACYLGDPSAAYAPHQPIPGCQVQDVVTYWDQVREGDLVLHRDSLRPVEAIDASRPHALAFIFDGGETVWHAPDAHVAVRRYITEESQ